MNRISAITCAAMCLFFSCGAAAQEADNQKGVLSETVLLGEKEPETEQLLIQKETGNKTTASGTSDETEEWTPAGRSAGTLLCHLHLRSAGHDRGQYVGELAGQCALWLL